MLINPPPSNDRDATLLGLLLRWQLTNSVTPNAIRFLAKNIRGPIRERERDDVPRLRVLEIRITSAAETHTDSDVLDLRETRIELGSIVVKWLPIRRVAIVVESCRIDLHVENFCNPINDRLENRALFYKSCTIVCDQVRVAVPQHHELVLGNGRRVQLLQKHVVEVFIARLREEVGAQEHVARAEFGGQLVLAHVEHNAHVRRGIVRFEGFGVLAFASSGRVRIAILRLTIIVVVVVVSALNRFGC